MASLLNFGVSGGCGSECGSAHYTKIGDVGVRRRGLWTSLALLKLVAAHGDRRDDERRGPVPLRCNI